MDVFVVDDVDDFLFDVLEGDVLVDWIGVGEVLFDGFLVDYED